MKPITKNLIGGLCIAAVGAAGWAGVSYVRSAPPTPTMADIAFGANPAQRLDVWKPAGKGPFPVVLTVHGGAFLFGDKRSHDGLKQDIELLLANGIAVAGTNYRLSGAATFPAAAQDVAAALAELHQRARSLGLDPDRIAIWGKSAGANLALVAGLAEGRTPIGNGSAVPVRGIVAMYPPVQFDAMDAQLRASSCGEGSADHDAADSPESKFLGGPVQHRKQLAAAASPLTYITPKSPPVLVQAGSADCMVPHQQSEMLAAALRRNGVPVRLDILSGAKHIDPVFDEPANLKIVLAFLRQVFSNQPSTKARS